MFEDVPVRVWLLLLIAASAAAPASYLYRHFAHSPSRRDITQPPVDLGWRSSRHAMRSVAMLIVLLALAVFIFTPAAAELAQQRSFWPLLLAVGGAFVLWTVTRDIRSGSIEPLVRHLNRTFERRTQPKRFWASAIWNTLVGCGCLWGAFAIHEQDVEQDIRNGCWNALEAPRAALPACDAWLDGRIDLEAGERRDLLLNRGIAHYQLKRYKEAVADYSAAIREDPTFVHAHYNRGLAYHALGDDARARSDYGRAIQLQPNHRDALYNRGLVRMESGDLDGALADFESVDAIEPKNSWPLAERGLILAFRKDRVRAEQAVQAALALDPANPLALRVGADLSIDAGDMKTAADRLTAALKQDPDDVELLRRRAEAYWALGEEEKSEADDARQLQLTAKRKRG